MGFTFTVTDRIILGDMVQTYGTYTSDGGTAGGDIDAAMDECFFIKLEVPGAAVVAAQSVANETFPCDGHAVTVVTAANESGRWIAEGKGLGW
jgi:uncharacterized SAM-binding protein YcdF (DUF218 family)